jgi:hypothetical protein
LPGAAQARQEPPFMAALLTTLNVMKSAHNRGSDRLMSIWEEDVRAVEAAVEALALPSTDHEPGCQSGDFGPCDCSLSRPTRETPTTGTSSHHQQGE